MHHGRRYDGIKMRVAGHRLSLAPKLKEKDFDEVYEIPAGPRFGSSRAYPAAANAVAHVVVAKHALLDLIALAPRGWLLHLESRPIPDCFHGHFCLGAGVVDLQHGGCQQPWVTSVSGELT